MINVEDGQWVKIEQLHRNALTEEVKGVGLPVQVLYRNDARSYVAQVDGEMRAISEQAIREVMPKGWSPSSEA